MTGTGPLLPLTDRDPDPMTITMLRIYVGGLDQFAALLTLLPDSFYHLPSPTQEMAYERMLAQARRVVGTIDITELAEIGAEVCNG